MHDAAGSVTTPKYRVVQGVYCETRFHPVADGVADDPSGEHVLDRAEIELALVGPVLGDVGQPQLVDVIRGEVPLDQVIVHRRSRALPDLAALLPERRPPLVVPADPPRSPLAHPLTHGLHFAGEEPVAELGIIQVGVEQGVRPIGLDQLGLGDLLFPPAVVRLAGELQDPQGHRDRDPVTGELAHERVEPFPGRFAWER